MDERLNEINRELKELNEALARQGRMEAQWKDLQDQRAERDRRVMETGRVFRKEQDDVDRLEKGGLRALLLSLTGDREVRLSKERREALAAKLQYDQAQRDLEDLDGRIGVLLREKDGLRIDRIRRDALLEEKGELLKALGGETGARLARLAQQCLSRFRTELADVRDMELPQVQVGEFATFADYFFDGIFVDWYIQSRINDAQRGVEAVDSRVCEVLNRLQWMDQELAEEQDGLKREREGLLLRSSGSD